MSDTKASEDRPTFELSARWRGLISALVVFHLAAVIAFPAFFQSRNTEGEFSPLAEWTHDALSFYIDVTYLRHGYAFFAPNPGSSHMIRYEAELENGDVVELTFPDIDRHWPRLLYHRHFMLAEQLNSDFQPANPPPELPPRAIPFWERRRTAYETKWNAFRDHLMSVHDAENVNMTRIEHQLHPPFPNDGGVNLRDPKSFVELGRDDLPVGPQNGFVP